MRKERAREITKIPKLIKTTIKITFFSLFNNNNNKKTPKQNSKMITKKFQIKTNKKKMKNLTTNKSIKTAAATATTIIKQFYAKAIHITQEKKNSKLTQTNIKRNSNRQ